MKGLKHLKYGLLVLMAFATSLSSLPSAPVAQAAGCPVPSIIYVDAVGGVNKGSGMFGCWGETKATAYETIQFAFNELNSRFTADGGSSTPTIIYKTDNGTESVINNTKMAYTIKPWSGFASTTGQFNVQGKNITIKEFTFNGGGIKVSGTSKLITLTTNTFNSGSLVEVTSKSAVDISNNTFSKTYAYIHDNTQRVTMWQNTFSGGAPSVTINYGSYSTAYGNWYTFVEKQTGGFEFVGNKVTEGQALQMRTSPASAIIMSNNVAGNSLASEMAFYLYDSEAVDISHNTISKVGKGIKVYGFASLLNLGDLDENNITLVNDAVTQSNGIEMTYAHAKNIDLNTISGADLGIYLDLVTADQADSNKIISSINGLLAYQSNVDRISNSDFTGASGIGVRVAYNSTVDFIEKNLFGDGQAGIIVESVGGEFSSTHSGHNEGGAGATMGTGLTIRNNTFTGTGLGIGLSNAGLLDINNNVFTSVDEGVVSYSSVLDKVKNNTLTHTGNAGGVGMSFDDSFLNELFSNKITDFATGLELLNFTELTSRFDGNLYQGGTYGVLIDNANVDAALMNSLFVNQAYGLTIANGEGLSLLHSTFYNNSTAALMVDNPLTVPMVVANNVFANIAATGAISSDGLGNLSVLDYNLYSVSSTGLPLLKDLGTGSSYKLTDLQGLGRESHAYEETLGLASPGTGDFRLKNSSVGINSADGSYGVASDYNKKARPYCNTSDRGAFETPSAPFGFVPPATDSDGDLLCSFQETALGSSDTSADSDGDGLSDLDEQYTYRTGLLVADTDADSFTDGEEVDFGSDPLDPLDYPEDADHDGMDDTWESTYGLDPYDSSDAAEDLDSDGLTNLEEYELGYDPSDSDMDDDELLDGEESIYGTDVMDPDNDGDGYLDGVEVAAGTDPLDASDHPEDFDGDGLDDSVDTDDDNDSVLDSDDAFDYDDSEWSDTDSDGTGDNSDTDDDNDGVADGDDEFPYDSSESVDVDGDGVGDNSDTDDDNDGVADSSDAFPYDSSESADSDADGLGDNADTDDDNDGYTDSVEISYGTDPYDSTDYPSDVDGDGLDDATVDTDDDNDGVADVDDAFPYDATESSDNDGDGFGDNLDTDDDNDGVADSSDAFPYDSSESTDTDGDGTGNNADTDDDNDGVADSSDAFPYDASEITDTDSDGIGNNADTDDDNDGVADSSDAFPYDASESTDSDSDGTGDNADTDDDNDGTLDSSDAFPYDASETTDTDLDGTGNNADTDDDNDGASDTYEISEGTDPLDPSSVPTVIDSDGDLFTDDYEISEGTDPYDAGDMPTLTLTTVGYFYISNYGVSGSWLSAAVYYYDQLDVDLSNGTPYYIEVAYTQYGVLGVSWNEDEYLGTIGVKGCGTSSSSFEPTSTTCSSVGEYATSGDPLGSFNHLDDSSQYENWSVMPYTFEDYDWYRAPTGSTSSTTYGAYQLTLAP